MSMSRIFLQSVSLCLLFVKSSLFLKSPDYLFEESRLFVQSSGSKCTVYMCLLFVRSVSLRLKSLALLRAAIKSYSKLVLYSPKTGNIFSEKKKHYPTDHRVARHFTANPSQETEEPPPSLRSPAGPECYCACVNSRSRGRHSYISYYIHHCTIQVTHTFQQLLKNLDFTRHPIDTRQCSTTALALIYLTLFSMGFKYFALFISFQKILYLFVRRA